MLVKACKGKLENLKAKMQISELLKEGKRSDCFWHEAGERSVQVSLETEFCLQSLEDRRKSENTFKH